MFFALTDEQRALSDSVRDYLRDRFDAAAVRAVYDDPTGSGDPDRLWQAVGEQGWLAVLVPEAHDGLGLGLLDASVIARRWGAATVPGPWLSTLLAAEAVRLGGSEEQQAAWLPRFASGELRATVALRRPGGAWSPEGAAFTAAGGRLSGVAAEVEYAHSAGLVVCAGTDGGLHLLDPQADGVTVERHDALDRTTRLATLTLDGAPAERLSASSADVVQQLHDRGAVLVANDLAGIAREALTRTVAYDVTREQFGRPIGSFQAIKHALADLAVAVTMAEHGALYAAHAVDSGTPDAAFAVSVAKSKASDTARDATAAMVQYHGGIGYTWEHEAHLFFKRAWRLAHVYGDSDWHRERIAKLVVDPAPDPVQRPVGASGPVPAASAPAAAPAG